MQQHLQKANWDGINLTLLLSQLHLPQPGAVLPGFRAVSPRVKATEPPCGAAALQEPWHALRFAR